jgi:hypothetical protein
LPLILRDGATDGVRLRFEASLRDVGNETHCGMGCSGCVDFGLCGGLHLDGGFLDCGELCCNSPKTCKGQMCRFKMADFARRHTEIGGFDLERIGPAPVNPAEPFPIVVPMIYHGKSRRGCFYAPAIAVRLRDLYRKKTGEPRFASRAEFAAHFRVAETARIIVTGIDNDHHVERWWSLSEKRAAIIRNLRDDLGVDLVTVPNFSLPVDWPRWGDLYSMKRIGLCWHELAEGGLTVALHPNARTERDFERWQFFIAARPEVTHLAFEFTTGAGGPEQREKYAGKLAALARAAGRPMHLVVMGGQLVWPRLSVSFGSLTVLETSIFMKTQHRQRAVPRGNRGHRFERIVTAPGEPVDELMDVNAEVIGASVVQQASPPT